LISALTPEQINSLITFIAPIITAGIGVGGARWVVSKWQTRKDISEIRKDVLRNYAMSFKNHVNLMDNFVAELIMSYAKFDNSPMSNGQELPELLPWGYTYKDLDYYSKKIAFDKLQDWKGREITEEELRERFEKLEKFAKCYIDFQAAPLKKFGLEYLELKMNFYKSRPAVMEFRSLVNQYYGNSAKLLDNFTAMWEYMMACYVLINRVMYTESREDFVEKIDRYNECSYYLFYILRWFEEKLVNESMEIDKNSRYIKWRRRLVESMAWSNHDNIVL
jgi:hypothetical protein